MRASKTCAQRPRWRAASTCTVGPNAGHGGAGSGLVKQQAEQEGLDKIFIDAGFEWREPGCFMCLAMNADRLEPGQRCASTSIAISKRQAGRPHHLVSPAMAAAAAFKGHFVDVRTFS